MKTYKNAVKKHLHCGGAAKRKLLAQLNDSLKTFAEDYPSPSFEQIEEAFGPPDDFAKAMMESVSQQEQLRYSLSRKVIRYIAAFSAVLFVLFSLYVFYIKECSEFTYYSEVYPNESTVATEG